MITAAELFGYVVLMLLFVRVCVWLFGRLEERATRRFEQRLTASRPQPADNTEETPMVDDGLTRESLARIRARNDKVTAAVRSKLGELSGESDAELQVLGRLILSNLYGSPVAVAGVAALTTLDLAVAQAEIIRLQAELDGERAEHAACHDRLFRATRGDAS